MVGRAVPRPEYPRPQFRREDWINLNGEWYFAFDDEDAGLAAGWQNITPGDLGSDGSPFDRSIVVPFCYQSKLSGIGETAFHDVVWYARTFEYAPAGDERLLLHFGAVDYRATVWVNGAQVASHEGGHAPFSADVTDALGGEGGENVVVVRAEDPSRDVTIPRGKQYWKEESEGIFYTRTTGIWQTVWLEPANRQRIEKLRLTPDVDNAGIDMEIYVEGVERGMSLRARVTFEGEPVLEDTIGLRSSPVERSLPLLWRGDAPDTPHLSEWPGAALWSPRPRARDRDHDPTRRLRVRRRSNGLRSHWRRTRGDQLLRPRGCLGGREFVEDRRAVFRARFPRVLSHDLARWPGRVNVLSFAPRAPVVDTSRSPMFRCGPCRWKRSTLPTISGSRGVVSTAKTRYPRSIGTSRRRAA